MIEYLEFLTWHRICELFCRMKEITAPTFTQIECGNVITLMQQFRKF